MLPDSIGTAATTLGTEIVRRIEGIVQDAERKTRPLEMDPYRGQLFELFVTAEGAGLLSDDSGDDLTADGLCCRLAERFGLRQAATDSSGGPLRLSEAHLGRMRLLWSVMRMWMEWTYAWQRWPEFHAESAE